MTDLFEKVIVWLVIISLVAMIITLAGLGAWIWLTITGMQI